MLQIVIQGPEPQQRTRQVLLPGRAYSLGRDPAADIPVPWEAALSRRHAKLTSSQTTLSVEQLAAAANPLFVNGEPRTSCQLAAGGQFVVGGTRFLLVEGDASSTANEVVEEVTFTRQQLQQVRYRDADRRIEVLSRLPDLIAGAASEKELHSRLASILLSGIPHAEAVAVVANSGEERVNSPYWERRREAAGAFKPSARLVAEALRARQSVLHVWESSNPLHASYTVQADFDWAFCTPVGQDGERPWGLYVAGGLPQSPGKTSGQATPAPSQLQADVKFTELVADVVASTRRLQSLEGNLSVLRQFLSPPILAALEGASQGGGLDSDLLMPRECEVTVLFCDLRGFSRKAEAAGDDLPGLLDRVGAALEIMTREILHRGGVTGDFLGDASLGFWGWPFSSEEAPLNACRAALAIRRTFAETAQRPGHPLENFSVGIGVARGRAMAGKIGTQDRVTVTVFGPVVNLASRLEGMTKLLNVPILLDEETAAIVRARLGDHEGRTRMLGKILPYGLERPLMVSELLPPVSEFPDLTNEHLRTYETGVEHFVAGRWEEAYRCLHAMPPSDRAQDFLTLRIAEANRTAPRDWDGVIRLPSK
ncbi:MAG: adenylate/guanylate cyclase domain-containing protein [Planctomycetaceae bacterium]